MIVHIDLETTSAEISSARIVQIAYAVNDDPPRQTLINPCIPIPAEATAIHGISDEMVKDAPTFRQVAKSLLEKLAEAEAISGFNIESFDLPLLSEEFAMVGIIWPIERPKIIDTMRIYHHLYPRKLGNAVATFCGREQTAAHDAGGDVIDSRDVLAVMRQRSDFEAVLAETHDKGQIDLAGKIVRDAEGDAVYTFGQHKGRKLREEPGFARWMLGRDFPSDTKRHIEKELARI
jgi:DNA polymerase-3 subunit epsilon